MLPCASLCRVHEKVDIKVLNYYLNAIISSFSSCICALHKCFKLSISFPVETTNNHSIALQLSVQFQLIYGMGLQEMGIKNIEIIFMFWNIDQKRFLFWI